MYNADTVKYVLNRVGISTFNVGHTRVNCELANCEGEVDMCLLSLRSRRIGEVSHHNLFIILQRCMNKMSEFHTPIKICFELHRYAVIKSCFIIIIIIP